MCGFCDRLNTFRRVDPLLTKKLYCELKIPRLDKSKNLGFANERSLYFMERFVVQLDLSSLDQGKPRFDLNGI